MSTASPPTRSACGRSTPAPGSSCGLCSVPARVGTFGAVPTIPDGVVCYDRGVSFAVSDGGVFAVLRMAGGEVLLEARVTRTSGATVVVANDRILLPEGAFEWVPVEG